MPKTRGRKARRDARRTRSRDRGRVSIGTVRPGQDLSHLLTDDDHAHMRAEADAAARGDARTAYEHHEAGLQVEGSIVPYKLRELVVLGDEAPGWVYARWCLDQAFRWMLLEEDPRTDDAVRQTMVVAHWAQVQEVVDHSERLLELGNRIAGADWICQQLAVYDYNGLRDFLDVKAEPALIDRADRVRDWADAVMCGYVLEEVRGSSLVVRDLSLGSRVDVLNIGAHTDGRLRTPVIGRLVPISVGPGLMFESRPVSVDQETAEEVARATFDDEASSWIPAVGNGRHEDRLPYAFSCRDHTLYASDIVPLERLDDSALSDLPPPGREVELLEAGLDEYQANGVMVAEVALQTVELLGAEAAGAVGPHVSAVLLEPRIFEAVRRHCTSSDHAQVWQILAECTTEPTRSRCDELARLSAA